MAANTSTDTLPKPALGFCKKCNSEHEKPIGNKCEKLKNVKEEKRDLSRETVKKTPRGKPADSHEKMMDMMLNTMNSVTEKLASMDERISGLTARIDTPAVKPSTRKSRSREQVKRRGTPDKEEALFSSPVAAHAVIQEGGTAYSQVFADTAVAIKPTPVRPKKHKATIDLGCTPLMQTATARVTSTVTSQTVSQPLAETVAQPQDPPTQIWTTPQDIVQQPPHSGPQTKQPVIQDCNQNILFGHVDQFGNPVRVQGPAEAIPEVRDTFVPVTEHPITVDAGPVSNINMLRSNPLIQQMVEERMALLEAKMKLELQGGMSRRRKSGRYNISDTPHSTPHLRWPNESCVIGTARKRTTFDELTLGQFVIGLVTNALDTQHIPTMKIMLNELVETVKLAENISWPIARGAFAASMLKIEDEGITWADSRTLADHRLTYSQSAVFSGSTTMSPRIQQTTPGNGSIKKIACKWFNEGTCPHSADHLDITGTTLFRHVCLYCFKTLKRNNVHVEADCFNNKKTGMD